MKREFEAKTLPGKKDEDSFFPAFFIYSVQAFHSSPTFIKEDGKKPIKKKGGSIMSCGKPHKKAKKKAKKKKK